MTEPSGRTWEAARRHRPALEGVVFVGVTGSCGKTTTKDLVATVLGSRLRGSSSEGSTNCGSDLVESVLGVQPEDRFHVQELGAWGPGTLEPGIELVQPDVAVVTNLRQDHYSGFHGPRGAQTEKGKLVASLPAGGTAVLNWDDPLVRALAEWTPAATLSFGTHPDAALRASDVAARWPDRLSFSVTYAGAKANVRTQLVGEHLLGSALAAIGVALLLGLDLDEAASALARARPTFRRMSPVACDDGVTFIRDDFKAPADSLPEVLAFMRDATAPRRLAVLGTISDFPGRSRRVYEDIAHQAIETLDGVFFVSERAVELWGEQRDSSAPAQEALRRRLTGGCDLPYMSADACGEIYVIGSVQHANAFLGTYLRRGDLVLLKGSGPTDHLERVVLDRERAVACWLRRCGRTVSCDDCELLRAADLVAAGAV